MFVLTRKLQTLKGYLREWNYNNFGNVSTNVKTAKYNLLHIQTLIQNSGKDFNLRSHEFKAQAGFSKALDLKECFWREKSEVKWHLEEDRNTYFFHRIYKINNSFKPITVIKNEEDTLIDPNLIITYV